MAFTQLSIDCTDPQRMVTFWSAALGYVPEPPPAGFATWNEFWRSIGVPEHELPTDVDAQDSIVNTLADPSIDHFAVTLVDPEGNEFCVN